MLCTWMRNGIDGKMKKKCVPFSRGGEQSNVESKLTSTVHPYAFRFHRIAVL